MQRAKILARGRTVGNIGYGSIESEVRKGEVSHYTIITPGSKITVGAVMAPHPAVVPKVYSVLHCLRRDDMDPNGE